MRIRLRLFGYTVCSLVFDAGDALELVDDDEIGGGAGVWVERDPDPPDPAKRHNHEYEDRRLGFQ